MSGPVERLCPDCQTPLVGLGRVCPLCRRFVPTVRSRRRETLAYIGFALIVVILLVLLAAPYFLANNVGHALLTVLVFGELIYWGVGVSQGTVEISWYRIMIGVAIGVAVAALILGVILIAAPSPS